MEFQKVVKLGHDYFSEKNKLKKTTVFKCEQAQNMHNSVGA